MKNDDILSDIDKKILQGRRLGVFNDSLGQKLLKFYHYGILDPWAVGQINSRVDKALKKELFAGEQIFKLPKLPNGQLIMGADQNKNPVRSPIQYLNAGSLLVANTGSGKTTLVSFYALQIARFVKGMWLVDLRKKEFRLLMQAFANISTDLKVIRGRKFKINPLQVPFKTEPYEYASTIADVLVKVLNLPPRASVLLNSTIIKLYKQYNVFNGSRKFPTLFHLFEAIKTDRNANSQARQAILDNLEALLLAFGTEVLGYYRGWPVDQLAKHHIVFELTGLPEAGKDLILNYLVAAEFISRIARGISNKDMDLWISLDESQRLFSQRKEVSGYGGNSITDLAGLVRGTGTGLFISVLTPDDLSNKIPAITSTKILGRCGHIKDYEAAGKFLGLNSEQEMWCAHHMIPGTFVGQLGDGNWRYPFLFKVPKMNSLTPISDFQTDNTLSAFDNFDIEPVEFTQWPPVTKVSDADTAVNSPKNTYNLTDSQLKLLKAIVENPYLPSSSYVRLAGISPNTLAKLRPILIQQGFISEKLVDPAGRGRSQIILFPLDLAKQAVNEYYGPIGGI